MLALLLLFVSFFHAQNQYADVIKALGYEGTVLLENKNNALPLQGNPKVAVFGYNQINFFKGGGGSGDVNVAYSRNLIYGLQQKQQQNKIQLYQEFVDQYQRENRDSDISPEQMQAAIAQGVEVAIYTIGRTSGEGGELNDEQGSYRLSDFEQKMFTRILEAKFKKLIVILNVGNVIDSSWYTVDGVDAVLLVYQPGMEGGVMISDLLVGDAYPSGKLVDTLAKTYNDYPSSKHFKENDNFVSYEEDIYVGYRYFETLAPNAVNYEFGFGLGYTTFAIEDVVVQQAGDNITVDATVRNTGNLPGKEVVQVYYGAPQGKLGKPAKVLGGFQKTAEIAPGGRQALQITFPIKQMASYDDTGKVADASYVLEAGQYHIYVGNSVKKVVETNYVYNVPNLVIVEKLTHHVVPKQLRRRLLSDGSYEDLPVSIAKEESTERYPSSSIRTHVDEASSSSSSSFQTLINEEAAFNRLRAFEASRSRRHSNADILLKDVKKDPSLMGAFIKQLSDGDLVHLAGGTQWTNPNDTTGAFGDIPRFGIPNIGMCDGPAGTRLEDGNNNFAKINTTAWPIGTMIGSMWNPKLAESFGAGVGDEMNKYHIGVWLAPGMNIHRDPLCGRNFEYISEDPLVSGLTAAGIVRGTQSQGATATIKHFFANNREHNRENSDSRMSERAAREIYLKNFEICIKNGNPGAVMTSYNLVNGAKTSTRADTLTDILRGEWGFEGFVMTDWGSGAGQVAEAAAGNDVKMWAGDGSLQGGLNDGRVTRAQLERNTEHILHTMMWLREFDLNS